MEELHNRGIFFSLLKETLLLQLAVAVIWFFIYKLYKHDVKNGKLIFLINVLIYISCIAYLINDLGIYSDLRVGGIGFAFEISILILAMIATFLLVVEYFIIKLVIRAFVANNKS